MAAVFCLGNRSRGIVAARQIPRSKPLLSPKLERLKNPVHLEPGLSLEPVGEFTNEEIFEDISESVPPSLHPIEEARQEAAFEFEEEDLDAESMEPSSDEEPVALEASKEPADDEEVFEETAQTSEEGEDASASHRVDPSAPTGFRLFGFGKKKESDPDAESKAGVVATPVSTYAPGQGPVEEELIEGEEFDAAPHARRHKPEVNDLDDYEEETLAGQTRSGELGEMLQEAHLDHRIQLKFEEKNGEDEEVDGDDEEVASTGAAPAPGRERHDRGGRGQRGRGAPGRGRGPSRRSAQTSDLPIISDLLKSGQEILVQIAKEPIAKKGARITSHIALPGRFLVFMPTVTHVGVSRKIASDEVSAID